MKTSICLSLIVFNLCHVLLVNSQQCVCVSYDACNYDYSLKENATERHETRYYREDGPRPSCDSAIDVCCDLSTSSGTTTTTSRPSESDKENLAYQKSTCGRRGKHSFEGDVGENLDAEFGEFPWAVAVLRKERYLCGGTLINYEAVLTGAYDIDKLPPQDLIVRVGQYPWKPNQEFYQDVRVKAVHKHPNFDEKSFTNNYAVLILTEPVKKQPYIKPICLPASRDTYEWKGCIETGWGPSCNVAFDESATLKKTFLGFTDPESCKRIYRTSCTNNKYNNYYNYGYQPYGYSNYGYGSYGYGGYGYGNYRYRRDNYWNDNYRDDTGDVDKSLICAADSYYKTPYTGNGGSPLICPLKNNRKRYAQAGIAICTQCSGKYKPGLYADVSEAKPWIDQVMNQNNLLTDSYEA